MTERNRTKPPEPGIYPGVSFEEYLSWDALNHSTLRHIAWPAKFKAIRETGGDNPTPSKLFGTMAHSFVLEPERFEACVIPAPINPKTNEAYGMGTKAWADYAEANPGKIIAGAEHIQRLKTIAANLRANPGIEALLAVVGDNEACLVWDDKTSGERCKARVDRMVRTVAGGRGIRFDLKTTADADLVEFSRSLVDYGYHTQDEFYRRGCEALGFDALSIIVVVESEPPHLTALFEIGEETARASRAIVSKWLNRLVRCKRDNDWPGYPQTVQTIEAPTWWLKQFTDATE
jgi:hypothetical protein